MKKWKEFLIFVGLMKKPKIEDKFKKRLPEAMEERFLEFQKYTDVAGYLATIVTATGEISPKNRQDLLQFAIRSQVAFEILMKDLDCSKEEYEQFRYGAIQRLALVKRHPENVDLFLKLFCDTAEDGTSFNVAFHDKNNGSNLPFDPNKIK